MQTCTAEFTRMSAVLHGLRCDADPFVSFANPFTLQNWTMPVIEVAMVAGAVAGLVHAARWYRRTADASNLVVWFAGVAALLLIEPIAYFPQWFGLERTLGLTFVHNHFTVQFLYDRLPLYIVAMYPAFGYLAYALVQRTGVFERYRPIVGAACTAFVFHCFYEVFDTVAPQWRWWEWNTELASSRPALGVVPYLNLQSFSLVLPFGLALIALHLRRSGAGIGRIVRDIAIVSVSVWPLQFLASAPATAVDLLGGSLEFMRAVSLWVYVAVAALATLRAFRGVVRTPVEDAVPTVDRVGDHFVPVCAFVYMAAGAMFWLAGLPDYLAARSGFTPSGAPVGSLAYGVLTFVFAAATAVFAEVIVRRQARWVGGSERMLPASSSDGH